MSKRKISGNVLKAYWIQDVMEEMKKKGTVGALHKMLGIKEGEKIPLGMLEKSAKEKGKLGQRARFALNMRKLQKNKKGR